MKSQRTSSNTTETGDLSSRITTVLFSIYLIAICWILLFKLGVRFSYMEKRSVNLIPLNEPFIFSLENILNVIIFVPLGIYTGVLFERWPLVKKLFFFFLVSLVVEALQYLFRIGAFDVTDIITNSLGGIVGLTITAGITKAFNSSVKARKFINIVATTGTALMILLLLLLKLNMLPIRYQ